MENGGSGSRQKPPRMWPLAMAAAISLAVSALFFWAFYERYLRWDFNELGRHYDAENQIVHTTAGFVYVLPAVGFLLAALGLTSIVVARKIRLPHGPERR